MKIYSFKESLLKLLQPACIAGLLFATLAAAPGAVTTNYFSNFESSSGYTAGIGLDNQNGWTGVVVDTTGTAYDYAYNDGNGVIAGGLGGSSQAAYVGLTPLPAAYNGFLDLYPSFSFDPVASGKPIVKFSSKVKVLDSNNGHYDRFYYIFYNASGNALFSSSSTTAPLPALSKGGTAPTYCPPPTLLSKPMSNTYCK